MKGSLGLASKIFSTVAKKGINIRMIAQGSSELNISFVVKEKDSAAVVRAIHEEFNLDKA
jgi:aspartate kinase